LFDFFHGGQIHHVMPRLFVTIYHVIDGFITAGILLLLARRQNPAAFPESSCLVAKNSPCLKQDGKFAVVKYEDWILD
jgi:hypothetical protein